MKRPLSVAEINSKFTTDDAGKLYWDGSEVRTGGLTRAETISMIGVVIAAVSATAAILKYLG